MAIITSFPSVNWKITFNKDDADLEANQLMISGNAVTSLSSSGITRDAVLQNPTDSLVITNTGDPELLVVSVQNADQLTFYDQVRRLLNVNLEESDLPNDVIRSPYLRSAEYEIYNLLMMTDTTYDSRAGTDDTFREKTRLATIYKTAALMVPAIPDIIRSTVFQTTINYAEYDPEKKQEYLDNLAEEEIVDLVPPDRFPTGFASGTFIKRQVCF